MSSTRPELKFSDLSDERSYFKKYLQLPKKDDASCLRFIEHNNKDYFSCIGYDAEFIADNIYKTHSVIKTRDNFKYVTISPQVFSNVLKYCLIEKHLKVEIYNNKSFNLICSATPGNLEFISEEYNINFEFQDCSNSVIAAVKVVNNKIGVCLINDDIIYLCEFDDNDLFSNLESLLLQMGVKEVILNNEDSKLLQVLNKIGNLVINISSKFSNKNIEQDLSKILEGDEDIELILSSKGINTSEYQNSLSSCNALIDYLNLLNGNKMFTINQYNLSEFMKLDSSTMKALNIFPEFKSNSINSIFELYKCKTNAGSRLLSQWLKQPLTKLQDIKQRQDLVQLLIEDTSLRVSILDIFGNNLPDIKRLLKKISSTKNEKLEHVVSLYKIVLKLPDLIEVLKNTPGTEFWYNPLNKNYASLIKFQELVETTIDLRALEDPYADFNIRPEFDPSLIEINERLTNSLEQIKQIHFEVAEDLKMDPEKKLKLEQHQIHGWCFRLTRNDSIVLRNSGKKYIELQTVKAGVYFTTTDLKKSSQIYNSSFEEYNKKQRDLIKEVLSITLTYQSVFTELSLNLAHVDLISSFANAAMIAPTAYVKPTFGEEMILKESRHPLLELQDDINFIANDVELNNGKSFIVITGPNMGGKSTYIRQIGVIALMAQIGSYIPAEEGCQLPIFDAILSRVGAGDSQLKGLSTFMIEMLETSSILATATKNSLIIIDELGRGTSTYDGFGLAWSISEFLIKKQCLTLFATHFHELNQLSEKYKQVENLHVVAHVENEEDITLMYKVEPGVSDKSFGINVAELAKFPTKIIYMAKRKAEELEQENTKKLKTEDVEKLKKILKEWRSKNPNPQNAVEELQKIVDENNFKSLLDL
ncbi:unnamed protein product [Candida verbasci]|uniref:DNA mismatch repair protein MSH3 n=1 Tax=Candida verbasci TaxID=1227364 RepID=A0A9W4TY39_9ASCO|nr:unnamed protein product [Candida verbasci]